VDKRSLHYSLSTGGEQNPSKLARMLMEQGFTGGELERFSVEGVPDRALSVIIQYYAFEASQCRTTASPQVEGEKPTKRLEC
jgi:hypothetical protein